MTDKPEAEFDRRFAELEKIIEEMEASAPPVTVLPGLPRQPGLLASYFAANPTRH
jgi:hypothetical protein